MKTFFKKALRRILMMLRRVVYYNYSYRPEAVCGSSKSQSLKGNKQNVSYHEVYPSYISKLGVSEEMYKIYSDYPKHKMTVDTPPSFVVGIKNGRVYVDHFSSVAFIDQNNQLLGDISFQYSRKKWEILPPRENIIFKLKFFVKPVKLKGTAFSLLAGGGVAIGNYFHWLIDSLARIHLLKKSGLFDKVDWFLVHNLTPDFVMDSLKFLGIEESQVIEVDKRKHVMADYLVATSPVRGNDKHVPEWTCEFLKDTYLPSIRKKYNYPFIYISRSDARARHVLNEDALVNLLNQYSFKTIVLSKLNFEEKINVFSSARVVLSPIGAQLTNLVFCKKGATVIELFPEGFVLPDALDIANKVGLDYHYIICKNDSPSTNIADGRKEHLTVDLKEIQDLLDKVIASAKLNV